MQSIKSLAFCTVLASMLACVEEPPSERRADPWFVMSEQYTPSGFMGDGTTTGALKLYFDACPERAPGALGSCYSFVYRPQLELRDRWVGVVWQSPANNWGYQKPKIVEAGATRIRFKVRGSLSGRVKLESGGLGGYDAERMQDYTYQDPYKVPAPGKQPIFCNFDDKQWTECKVPLVGADGGSIFGDEDELSILGAFAWYYERGQSLDPVTLYFDDIVWE
jgi:hypothetical protein